MRRILSSIVSFLLLLILVPLILLFFAIQSTPKVGNQFTSTPEHAKRTKAIFQEFRALTEEDIDSRDLVLTEGDFNSMIAVASRAVPSLRGYAETRKDNLAVVLSMEVPHFPGGGWLNIEGGLRSSDRGLKIETARIGPYSLPSSLLLPVAGRILDWTLGDRLGQVALRSIDRVSISDDSAVFHVALGKEDRKKFARKFKNKVRQIAGVSSEKDVAFYYKSLEQAAGEGNISASGTFVPYLRHALLLSLNREGYDDIRSQKQAALLALAIYCGHPKFEQIVRHVEKKKVNKTSACGGNTLAGRIDLRQHFIISAGLKAAGDAGFAFAIGEFKELLDTNRGGSGFSFDDLAADRAGIRFAEKVLETGKTELATLLSGITAEEQIFPSISGLPSGLSKESFERDYVNVDSPAYKEKLKEIEQRIDQLHFYKK